MKNNLTGDMKTKRSETLYQIDGEQSIDMIKHISRTTGIVKGCEIYLTRNGFPLKGLKGGMTISQQKLQNIGETGLDFLRNFNIPISVDMIKEATAKAIKFSEEVCDCYEDCDDISVIEAYVEVIKTAKELSKKKAKEDEKIYTYDKNKKIVDINREGMKKILEMLDIEISIKAFMCQMSEYGKIIGRELIITERGRLQVNRSDNIRVYRFKEHDDIIENYSKNTFIEERKGA